jgi:DNA-directed RNA polymerase subunit alpha
MSPEVLLALELQVLALRLRVINALKKHRLDTIGSLTSLTENDVKLIRMIGKKSIQEIRDRLAEHGLALSAQ